MSAVRWAVEWAILMFDLLWGTRSQDSVFKPQLLKRKESGSGLEPASVCLQPGTSSFKKHIRLHCKHESLRQVSSSHWSECNYTVRVTQCWRNLRSRKCSLLFGVYFTCTTSDENLHIWPWDWKYTHACAHLEKQHRKHSKVSLFAVLIVVSAHTHTHTRGKTNTQIWACSSVRGY